jgi:hypothetical protein
LYYRLEVLSFPKDASFSIKGKRSEERLNKNYYNFL